MNPPRFGHGFDAHAFTGGDHVTVGGVRVPHTRGVAATSDGDVALHALCDALLGGAALGDLGALFPSDDDRWRGADSRDLLDRVVARVAGEGFGVVNADVTVICQAPKLAGCRGAMREAIAAGLRVAVDRVSIKFTTTDGLGFVGREDGLAAHAVVSLGRDS